MKKTILDYLQEAKLQKTEEEIKTLISEVFSQNFSDDDFHLFVSTTYTNPLWSNCLYAHEPCVRKLMEMREHRHQAELAKPKPVEIEVVPTSKNQVRPSIKKIKESENTEIRDFYLKAKELGKKKTLSS